MSVRDTLIAWLSQSEEMQSRADAGGYSVASVVDGLLTEHARELRENGGGGHMDPDMDYTENDLYVVVRDAYDTLRRIATQALDSEELARDLIDVTFANFLLDVARYGEGEPLESQARDQVARLTKDREKAVQEIVRLYRFSAT